MAIPRVRVVSSLGKGGMGLVWLAERELLPGVVQRVVVKRPRPDEPASPRFLDEARAHNVQVIWVGPPNMQKPRLSTAMAYLSGLYESQAQLYQQHYVSANGVWLTESVPRKFLREWKEL